MLIRLSTVRRSVKSKCRIQIRQSQKYADACGGDPFSDLTFVFCTLTYLVNTAPVPSHYGGDQEVLAGREAFANPRAEVTNPDGFVRRQFKIKERLQLPDTELWQVQAELALDIFSIRF
jgi:hypothetical protein